MPRMNVRQMWKAKLEGKTVPASTTHARAVARQPAAAGVLPARTAFHGLVLGIDPSLRGTGLAVLEFAPGRSPVLLRCRTVQVAAKRPMAEALAEIHRSVEGFLADFAVRGPMFSLVGFYYGGEPRVHYEVWVQCRLGLVEVGLHFEADAATTATSRTSMGMIGGGVLAVILLAVFLVRRGISAPIRAAPSWSWARPADPIPKRRPE